MSSEECGTRLKKKEGNIKLSQYWYLMICQKKQIQLRRVRRYCQKVHKKTKMEFWLILVIFQRLKTASFVQFCTWFWREDSPRTFSLIFRDAQILLLWSSSMFCALVLGDFWTWLSLIPDFFLQSSVWLLSKLQTHYALSHNLLAGNELYPHLFCLPNSLSRLHEGLFLGLNWNIDTYLLQPLPLLWATHPLFCFWHITCWCIQHYVINFTCKWHYLYKYTVINSFYFENTSFFLNLVKLPEKTIKWFSCRLIYL